MHPPLFRGGGGKGISTILWQGEFKDFFRRVGGRVDEKGVVNFFAGCQGF